MEDATIKMLGRWRSNAYQYQNPKGPAGIIDKATDQDEGHLIVEGYPVVEQ